MAWNQRRDDYLLRPSDEDHHLLSAHHFGRAYKMLTPSATSEAAPEEPSGGYEANFDPPLDKKLECPVCLCALRDPVQTPCGHRFCRVCITKLIRINKAKAACPLDKVTLKESEIYPDNWCRREVLTLTVKCELFKEGCMWKGTLKDLQEHIMNQCDYTPVSCPNVGCLMKMTRQQLRQHQKEECEYRQVVCNWCNVEILRKELDEHIRNECQAYPVPCKQVIHGCDALVPRGQMERHLREQCTAILLSCAYALEGCKWEGVRSDYRHHCSEQITDHVEKAGVQLREHNSELRSMNESLHLVQAQVREVTDTIKKGESAGIERKLQQTSSTVDNMMENMSRITSRVEALEGEARNTIRLQSHVEEQDKKIDRLQTEVNRLISVVERLPAEAQPAPMLAASGSAQDTTHGVLHWTIDKFSDVRSDAKSGRKLSLLSPVFHSSPRGYKMRVRLYPNGDGIGRGRHLSLFFTLAQGEHDHLLEWPFRHKVTFSLIDQSGKGRHVTESFLPDPKSSSFQKPKTEANVASGCPLFVHLERVSEESGFVRDDSILIKVSVDTSYPLHPY